MREVLGATVGSLGAVLDVVLVAVRDVLRWHEFWMEEHFHVKVKFRLLCAVDVT